MKFLSGGEKILELRKKLNLKQKDFECENFTRGYLGLLENGKRNITEEAAKIITKIFKDKALQLGVELDIDDNYFLRDIREEAEKYCVGRLEQDISNDEVEQIIAIGNQYELSYVKAKGYIKLGDHYYRENKYIDAFKNYFYSLDLLKHDTQSYEKCYVYNTLGMCKYMLLNYEEAMIYFNKAKDDSYIINEKGILQNSIYNLALCNKKILNMNEAIKLIEIFINNCDKEQNLDGYIYANTFKANCYEELGELDKCISIYEESIKLIDEENMKLLGYLYNNLGGIFLKKGDVAESLNWYNKSQQIRSKIDKANLARTLIEKSEIYIKKELYNEALMIIELGIEEAKINNDYEYIMKGYEILQEVYEKLEMYPKCKEILRELIKLLNEKGNILLQLKYYNVLLGIYLKEKNYDKVKECQNEIVNLFM